MKRNAAVVVAISLLTLSNVGCVSHSSDNDTHSKPTETDALIAALVLSFKEDVTRNRTATNFSVAYENSRTATLNYSFSNGKTNESGNVTYELQRFNSTMEASSFTNRSSADYMQVPLPSDDPSLSHYIQAARHQPKVMLLFVQVSYSPLAEHLLLQFDDVVIAGYIQITNHGTEIA